MLMHNFDFNGLFILDLANNHQGDMKHALNIIKAVGEVVRSEGVRGAFKFQFRHIETFIHPDYKNKKDIKHIPRFVQTALTKDQYRTLVDAVREQGLHTIATPFDEESVDQILDLDIEIIKVASCSATDRPLLNRVAQTNRPVVVSTAGLGILEFDRLVSTLESENVNFALMHCIALYPTPPDKLKLTHIDMFRERFPSIPVGFSTHEDPNNYNAIRIAVAKGAQLFERHVGIQTKKHTLNKYSSTPPQIAKWIRAYKETVASCGGQFFSPAYPEEITSLYSLMRGVYAKKAIRKGEELSRDKVFFAMPLQEGQLKSGNWVTGLVADAAYNANQAINGQIANFKPSKQEIIYRIMLQVQGMLNEARIFIGKGSSVELSHHYGLERFREFGAVIINCINRAYCKKLIIQLPRQKHPYHYHKRKEETFQLLYGDMEVEIEGKRTRLALGDTVLVKPGEWHKFHSLDGVIFEEVSTTHFNEDSIYDDKRIANLPREKRKTVIPN